MTSIKTLQVFAATLVFGFAIGMVQPSAPASTPTGIVACGADDACSGPDGPSFGANVVAVRQPVSRP